MNSIYARKEDLEQVGTDQEVESLFLEGITVVSLRLFETGNKLKVHSDLSEEFLH